MKNESLSHKTFSCWCCHLLSVWFMQGQMCHEGGGWVRPAVMSESLMEVVTELTKSLCERIRWHYGSIVLCSDKTDALSNLNVRLTYFISAPCQCFWVVHQFLIFNFYVRMCVYHIVAGCVQLSCEPLEAAWSERFQASFFSAACKSAG